MAFKWKDPYGRASDKRSLRSYYLKLIPPIREVARRAGYAIGVHGSLERDLDLIAAPWTDKAVTRETLLRRIKRVLPVHNSTKFEPWEKKPHGRRAIAIVLAYRKPDRSLAYVDLSVTR